MNTDAPAATLPNESTQVHESRPKPDGPCGTVNVIYRCKRCAAKPASGARPARPATPGGLVRTVVANKFRKFLRTDRWGAHHYQVSDSAPAFLECGACNGRVYGVLVKGKHTDKHTCGSKCLASTGPNCTCSCGGKNHGSAWSSAVELLSEIAALPAEQPAMLCDGAPSGVLPAREFAGGVSWSAEDFLPLEVQPDKLVTE